MAHHKGKFGMIGTFGNVGKTKAVDHGQTKASPVMPHGIREPVLSETMVYRYQF